MAAKSRFFWEIAICEPQSSSQAYKGAGFQIVPRPTHSGASTGSMATRSLVRVGSCSGPQDADFSILPRSALELQIVPFLVFASSDALYAFLEHTWR